VPNLVDLGQKIGAYSGYPPEKNRLLGIPSFKVTQGHWNLHGSIGHLWLPISDP